MEQLFLYGAGGHAKVIADAATLQKRYALAGFIDDEKKGSYLGLPVVDAEAFFAAQKPEDCVVLVAIGNTKVRKEKVEMLGAKGYRFATVIHPASTIANDVVIGEGSVVMAGAVINPGSSVGKHCIVNTQSSVDHDCVLGDYAHIAPGAVLGGTVSVGEGSWVGIGAQVREGITIGSSAVVGMGSVVLKDIPDDVKAFGVPAQIQGA